MNLFSSLIQIANDSKPIYSSLFVIDCGDLNIYSFVFLIRKPPMFLSKTENVHDDVSNICLFWLKLPAAIDVLSEWCAFIIGIFFFAVAGWWTKRTMPYGRHRFSPSTIHLRTLHVSPSAVQWISMKQKKRRKKNLWK